MSKRKRDDDAGKQDLEIEDQAVRIKVSRLKAKLAQGLKNLTAALKLARGLERQKLGRRQKSARDDPHTLLRLREEIFILKSLQLGDTAKNHLLKQLSRTNRIRESPVFVHIYGADPTVAPAKAGAEANVLGRLFSSNPVKQAMSEVMKNAFSIIGIPQHPNQNQNKLASALETKTTVRTDQPEDDEFHGFSSNESATGREPAQAEQYSEASEEEAFNNLAKHRLASTDDSESDAESLDLSDDGTLRDHKFPLSTKDRNKRELRKQIPEKPAASQYSDPTTKTSFLPSLSMAGYYSGSESDMDGSFDDRDVSAPESRKNRRGQRARQQIAQWKYGKNAKHLQKHKASINRNSGWDAKKGAIASRDHPKSSHRNGKDDTRRAQQPSQPDRPKVKSRDDQGSIHPSWEAAKKRKMQDQGVVAFSGKKITFD